ncbi:hypothetical protein [Cerasicoccus frondis]|uniref:hypothetical protein n=1 Tax=Cerasicoccus frondis TaxID=490090 RepID=UPI002852D8B4|nr:hypothetical protein [Cerasicoccus frondis]
MTPSHSRFAWFKAVVRVALFTGCLSAQSLCAFDYEDVPADRLPPSGWEDVQWADPGSWIAIDVTQWGMIPNDHSVDIIDKVNDIFAAYPTGNLLLEFPAGVFKVYSDMVMSRDNVRLRGQGSGSTEIIISMSSTSVGGVSFLGGGFVGSAIAVTNSPVMGADHVYADDTTLDVGDFVQLYLEDDPYGAHDNSGNYFYGQIFEITNIDRAEHKIFFDQKLGLDFPADYLPHLQEIDMLQNVGIEQMKVRRARHNDDGSFGVDNISMRYVNNGYVKQVESKNSSNTHIAFKYCINVIAEENDVHDSFLYDGGYGYGIVANLCTTKARISNNKLWNLRHHVLLQKGANHCVISYNSLEPDFINNTNSLCLHGHFPHNNLMEGNMLHQGLADNAWGANGPANTWFRNYATEEVGAINQDTHDQNLIGNILKTIWAQGTNHYLGANQYESGWVNWGDISSVAVLPESLYLAVEPAFMSGYDWPVYGPDVSSWGIQNVLPAYDR